MVDLTLQEEAAIRATVKPLARLFEEIGWDKCFADLTETQVLTLIETAVEGFQDAMRDQVARDDSEIPF